MIDQLQEWFQGILAAGLGIISFFLKDTHTRIGKLEDKQSDLHHVYLKKDDFTEFKEELWARLDDIKEIARK